MAVKSTGKVLANGLTAALWAVGCSSSPPVEARSQPISTGAESHDALGEIALRLTLPGGHSFDSIGYTVTNGTPANMVSGSYTFPAGAESPSFVISGIPIGTGYEILLSCTSVDGIVACNGSGPGGDASSGFDVTTGNLPVVDVVLTCTVKVDAGAQ
jgi:hypothetical protein